MERHKQQAKAAHRRAKARWKRAVKTVALVLASIALALILGEVLVFAVYGEKFGKRPGFYVADKFLGWKPAPNLDHTFFGTDYSIKVETDADGYRLGKLGEVDYSKKLVVLCGDSNTFGWGVSTDETFASYLDEMVYEASGGTTRVVNLGVGGYGLVQECDRLKEFLEKHPNAHVVSLIVQHSPNDATDNIAQLGYHTGDWETKTIGKPRSSFHLVNLVNFARERYAESKQPATEDTGAKEGRHLFLQDMLFAYERQGAVVKLPSVVTIGKRRLSVSTATSQDWRAKETLMRGWLSEIQEGFVLGSIECMEGLQKPDTKVFHAFIYTAADWYVDQVTELAEQSHEPGAAIVTLGRVPEAGTWDHPVLNVHTGGHYTAEFNEYWAQSTLARLREHGGL